MITSLAQLPATTRAAATSFLDASVAALPDADLHPGVREDLEAALLEQLDAASTPDDLAAVIERLGPVEAEAFGSADAADAPGTDGRAPRGRHGRLWGIPFDLRPPSGDRVREAWWDPTSDRILVPRVFGLGWTVNVGALAVRLGLIEPDAEDEPFTSTPEEAFKAAALLPLGLAAATHAHYAVRGG